MRKIVSLIAVAILAVGFLGISDSKATNSIKDVLDTVIDIDDFGLFDKEIELEKDEVIISEVVDGDTVKVEFANGDTESIRLLLIDTPESVHPNKPVQPFGKEASDYAKGVLQEGDVVTLEKGNPERDKYDRLLGYIWIDDVNFNQLMIEEGYARVAYVYEPNTKYLEEFEQAEKDAKSKEENIWSIPGYVDNEFEKH